MLAFELSGGLWYILLYKVCVWILIIGQLIAFLPPTIYGAHLGPLLILFSFYLLSTVFLVKS